MKWFLVLLAAVVVVVGCEPSIRYSSGPPKPVDDGGAGYTDPKAGGTGRSESSVDTDRMREIIGGYLGTSYRRGGYGKLGIDCSGLVYAVYRDLSNLHLPPKTKKLFNTLRRVSYRDLRYGDLVFFSLNGKHASHVGLYVGDNKFVHASESRGVVISSLSEDYYRQSYVGARRVTG
jgi:cell wall-associated NlpC family hydrolase